MLYDSPNERVRVPVENLDALPYEDANRTPIEVYDAQGVRVARRTPNVRHTDPSCGILMQLDKLGAFFDSRSPESINSEDEIDDVLEDDDPFEGCMYTAYPMAFLPAVGHYQAQGLIRPFHTVLRTLNNNLDLRFADEDDPHLRPSPFLRGVSSQAYNEVSHRVRSSAAHHEVQKGRITGTMAGASATGARQKRTYQVFLDYCEEALPHDRFAEQIKDPKLDRFLRMENVYVIELDHLQEDKRDGGSLYRHVMYPLVRAWTNAEIFEAVKSHCVIFKPEV